MAFNVTTKDNYWISPNAVSISLNALGDADRIQCSVAAGATILCYVKGVTDGDGLEFDVGHKYKHWPLSISPTFFDNHTEKYLYVAIPRSADKGTTAMFVFPSEKLDVYGCNELGEQIGSTDNFYIWLQGIISSSGQSGIVDRQWLQQPDWGWLDSNEQYSAGGDSTWWTYNPITNMVTFIKKIASAVFEMLQADDAEIGRLTVTNDATIGGTTYTDHVQSKDYTGDGMFDSGYLLQYLSGKAKLVVDQIVCRGKFVVNEIEDRIWTYSGGNLIFSAAGSTIFYVEYLDNSGTPLGYTYINSPWLLRKIPLLARVIAWSKRKQIQRSLTPEEKARVVTFRCYETSDDGTMQTRNWWHLDDIALCQTLNRVKNKSVTSGNYSGSLSNTVYARRVIGIGSKKIAFSDDDTIHDYVDLSRADCDPVYNDWPAAGDVIVQRGNFTNTDRQGFSTIEVTGDERGYKVYDGISGYEDMAAKKKTFIGYDARNKRALLEVFGDAYIGAMGNPDVHEGASYIRFNAKQKLLEIKGKIIKSSTIDDMTFDDYVNHLITAITDDIQKQVDQKAETWYQATDPSENWSDEEKKNHIGDLWYCTEDHPGTNFSKGTTWYYIKSTSSGVTVYGWVKENIPQSVFDTIDGKANIYVTWGAWGNELHVRDLYIPSADHTEGSGQSAVTYYKDKVYRCTAVTPKITFEEINYTDDTALTDFIDNTYNPFVTDIQSQVDGKAETWYQATDPSTAWTTTDEKKKHVGDLWYCTDDIASTDYKKGTTWFYKMGGTASKPTFAWVQQDVPEAVFDKIDGKAAIYTSWLTEWDTSTESLNVGDMLVPSADIVKGQVTYKTQKVYKWNGTAWAEINYTDDTALTDFVTNTYTQFVGNIQGQVDQKAETWYQATDPATAWTTAADKAKHVGDIWMDTSANGGKKTYIYQDKGESADPRYKWEEQSVPTVVFDTIDGKADIFVLKPSTYNKYDMWIIESGLSESDMPSGCQAGDIVISSKKRTNAYTKGDWKKRDRYTDDSGLTNFLTTTYATDKTNLQNQIDGKAETWYQNTDPSTAWTTTEMKNAHKGDIWHNTSNQTVGGVEAGLDAIWSGTAWVVSDVPQDVYDKIDGKADIFVSKPSTYNQYDLWIIESGLSESDMPSGCQAGDIVISSKKRTNAYNKADWSKKDRYTDDSTFNNWKVVDYAQQIAGYDRSIETLNGDLESLRIQQEIAEQQINSAAGYLMLYGGDAARTIQELNAIKADGKVDKIEKVSISCLLDFAEPEYESILGKATYYGVSTTLFTQAWTAGKAAMQKYSAATPEEITVQADFDNIAAYMSAYVDMLTAIANAANLKIDNITDDGVITGGAEKSALIVEYLKSCREYAKYIEQAGDYFGDQAATKTAAFTTAFVNMVTMLNNGDTPTQEMLVGTYYPKWINQYTGFQSDTVLADTPTENSANYRAIWDAYYTELNALVEAIIEESKRQVDVADGKGRDALSKLEDMASDSKLDPSEKQEVKKEFEACYHEMMDNNGILDKAKDAGGNWIIDEATWITPYKNAFAAIGTYLNGDAEWSIPSSLKNSTMPLWIKNANMGTTNDIVGSEWRNKWNAFYTKRSAVLTTLTQHAQATANDSVDRLNTWANDNYISPAEKYALKTQWEDEKRMYAAIKADATKYSVSTSAYDTAYTSANTAVTKYTAATPEDIAVGSDYANIAAYYEARKTIQDAISSAAKNLTKQAQDDVNGLKYVGVALTQKSVEEGGLYLTSLIALRDGAGTIWSGINGVYLPEARGGGIAAWYGGQMIDHEDSPATPNYAKALFRMDGSGYLAAGLISWNENGVLTAANFANVTTHIGDIVVDNTTIPSSTLKAICSMFELTGSGTTADPYVIKAKYSLYSEGDISAYGQSSGGGGGGGGASVLDDLNDVAISNPANGQALVYNGTLGRWKNTLLSLSLLSDVNIGTLLDGQVLTWSSAQQKWIASTSSAGVDMNAVWDALAASTYQQIAATHLSDAMNAFAYIQNGTIHIGEASITPTTSMAWSDITGKPDTFTPSSHTHSKSEITDFGSYLPISGGTLTGALKVLQIELGHNNEINNEEDVLYLQFRGNKNLFLCYNGADTIFGGLVKVATGVGISDFSGNGLLAYHPTDYTGASSTQWVVGALDCQGVIRSDDHDLVHYRDGDGYTIWDSSNFNPSNYINTSGGQTINNSLQVASVKIEQTNEINSYSGMLHLNYRVSTGVSLCVGGGNVGIGTANPSYRLHVSGDIYATGDVTAASDGRQKDIVADVELTVEQIAGAPAVKFRWKDKRDEKVHAGTIAQYWQEVLPEVVTDKDDSLGVNYGAAAMVSSINIAREVVELRKMVVDQQKTILEQQEMIADLRELVLGLQKEVERLKSGKS